jgi:signal transduction histidine kinase
VTIEAAAEQVQRVREQALLRGKVAIVFQLSHHYLFLPFTALCMAAALSQPAAVLSYVATPLVLQIFVALCASRLKSAYDNRDEDDEPEKWARAFTIMSGIVGAIWGVGAMVWFVPGYFPAQAYLVLAFIGMSATEFVGRAAYRPAYLAHAAGSLLPLVIMLIIDGGTFELLSAILVLFFGGVLYSYGATVSALLSESILLRYDNAELIVRLGTEKRLAESARNSAQANERAKTAFISNISHELRTPLNAILGMAHLLERGDLEKAQRDHVKVLLEAGRGLRTLLDDIIALAQHEKEVLTPPEEGTDAGQAARTVVRLLQPNAWEKRLRLSINVASGLPRVAADPRLLRRVLLKLVGNAIKFTERGNIEVAVDAIDNDAGRQMVRFVVTDTGPGIPHQLMASIFQPFAKGDDSYAARHSGAGVGLAVAKRLIESIGGTIAVESEPGMGATFWVTIPGVYGTVADETDQTDPTEPPSGLSLLVLLPDAEMYATVERLLTPFGNRIARAESLAQAATMSARGDYTLIIATASKVDALAAAPGQHTPILALVPREERAPDGADGVLRWPATPNALYAAIVGVTGMGGGEGTAKDGAIAAAVDAKIIAELEKSLGLKTLIDILQSYLLTAEELAVALNTATEREDWAQAGRLAQDFAGAAGGLGLTAIASSARVLAQGARDGANDRTLAAAVDDVLSEHRRVTEALRRLYPDLAA